MVTSRASLLLMLLLHVRPPAPFRHDQHQMLLLMFAHAQVTHPFIQFYSELTEPSWLVRWKSIYSFVGLH